MLLPIWLFVFNAYCVYAFRSDDHFKKSNYQNCLLKSFHRESRLKTNLESTSPSTNNKKNTEDQLLAEESSDDQHTAVAQKRFDMPDMDSWSMPAKKPKKSLPYAFGFQSQDSWGTQQYRKEAKTQDTVTGSYGYMDKSGIYRHVSYIADKNGFRARINTNEPGTANKNPASVIIESKPIQLNDKNDYKMDRNDGDYKQQASDVVKHQTEPLYTENRRTGLRKRQRKPSATLNDNYSNSYTETFATNSFTNDDRSNGDPSDSNSDKSLPNSEAFNRASYIDLAKLDNDNFINKERNDGRNHVNYLSSLDNLESNSDHNLINSPIKLWNEKPKDESNYPSFSSYAKLDHSVHNDERNDRNDAERIVEHNVEHNDNFNAAGQDRNEQNALDDQEDESYQINQRRRRRFRARL